MKSGSFWQNIQRGIIRKLAIFVETATGKTKTKTAKYSAYRAHRRNNQLTKLKKIVFATVFSFYSETLSEYFREIILNLGLKEIMIMKKKKAKIQLSRCAFDNDL